MNEKKKKQTTGTLQERSVAVDGRINGNRSKKGNKRTYIKKLLEYVAVAHHGVGPKEVVVDVYVLNFMQLQLLAL